MSARTSNADWFHQPVALIFWWALPIVVANVLMNVLKLSPPATAFLWAVAFAWMGTGCLLNAWRCGRVHCFITGPILWLGAVAAGLVGFGGVGGMHTLNVVITGTAVLATLAFVLERILGRYSRRPAR